jgi:hypothetical protein
MVVVGSLKIGSHCEKTGFVVKIRLRRSYRSAPRNPYCAVPLSLHRIPAHRQVVCNPLDALADERHAARLAALARIPEVLVGSAGMDD